MNFPDFAATESGHIIIPDIPLCPRIIASVVDDWDQDRHARLLAAAPRLLRELEDLLKRCRQSYSRELAGKEAFERDHAGALVACALAKGEVHDA